MVANSPAKPVLVFAVLLGAWIVAYWLWKPMGAGEVKVTRGDAPAATTTSGPSPLGQSSLVAATSTGSAIIDPSLTAPASEAPPELRVGMPIPGTARAATTAAPIPAATRSVERLIPPEFGTTIVQKGERGFEAISKRVYGTTKHAGVISKANPYLSPDKLKAGVTEVRYPIDPSNVQGKVVTVEVPAVGTPNPVPTPSEPDTSRGSEYVVKGEDTLSSIAKKFYGKSSAWQVIYDANRERIPSPDRLKPGTTIVIPAQ